MIHNNNNCIKNMSILYDYVDSEYCMKIGWDIMSQIIINYLIHDN